MLFFRDLPLRRKLVTILMVTSGAALLLASAGVLGWDAYRLRGEMARNVELQAAIVAENTVAAVLFDDAAAAAETLGTLRQVPRVERAIIYDADGNLFARYDRDERPIDVPPGPPGDRLGFTDNALEIVRGIAVEDRRVGTLYIRTDLEGLRARFVTAAAGIGLMLGLSFLGAFLLSNRLQRLITDPVLRLADTARRVSSDRDYSRRAEAAGRDEVGVLVGAFNQMLADIQERDEQLREANRLKDEFLATLSHELRTPLNAVLGWSFMLKDPRLAPDVRVRAIESIERNARAQHRLIEDLLEISRSVSHKLRLDVGPVDLAAVVKAAVDVVRPAAEARGIQLDLVLDRRPPTSGDAGRLQQVVWNLLSNAVKFSEPGGRVSVALSGSVEADEITVSDTGMGIAPSFLPHVFDAFRQADGSPTRSHGGLGLGLAIVRHLVDLHGGTVSVQSEGPGKGATFTVRLPRHAVAAPPKGQGWASSGRQTRERSLLRGLRILLVEDDEDARTVAAMALQNCGAAVTAVDSAGAAYSAIRQSTPDIIVSDIGMEGQDGYGLIEEVRRLSPERGGLVPAVALTAYASPSDRERALSAGFQAHVAKPYEPEALLDAIAAVAPQVRQPADSASAQE